MMHFCDNIFHLKYQGMSNASNTIITAETEVNAPVEKVWDCWTNPDHIICWHFASADWQASKAQNDLKAGGSFSFRMEAKDGTMCFDFSGVYTAIKANEYIEYTLDDQRKVTITFGEWDNRTKLVESFEAESENTVELQKGGWQAILDNFKKYTESIS